ncbi:hypothetical protein JCM10003_1548 [Bacteroides pyogenes JCM 10003]|nr:hypothetical protein JCM10003_1548 [Bacteroides pyogenes JCM 10003]
MHRKIAVHLLPNPFQMVHSEQGYTRNVQFVQVDAPLRNLYSKRGYTHLSL